jgi:DNA-binding CsgD family transcriptional regulator
MLPLEWIWEERNRTRVLLLSLIATAAIACADWLTKPYVSLGFLYLFPIMLAAGVLPRWAIATLGIVGAALSALFSSLDTSLVRLAFESLALSGCGLFVGELIRNRRLSLEAQENVRVLVETSPAAIVTVDERGVIELANRAALELLLPRDNRLVGNPIAAFLPELHHALRWEEGPQFRTSMQCRGHRGNSETFMADVWFSTYKSGSSPRLAAIIADVTDESLPEASASTPNVQEREDLLPREAEVVRLVVQGLANKQIASQLSLSESTIKNTLQQLFAKTSVRTRAQLVRVALERYRDLL